MKNNISDNTLCCGCSSCAGRCPSGAIYIDTDIQGRYRAFVREDKCTNCGLCNKICPTLNPIYKNNKNPECYAFDNDEEISIKSSTAGGFQVLAKYFISQGGKVAGAAWVEDDNGNKINVCHVIADSEKTLKPILKSKYVQSFMGNIYEQLKQELEEGVKFLFSGTPCQVAGLYSFLGKDYENLYTVDLICYHAPSQKYFKSYLKEMYPDKTVKEFDFRAKNGFSTSDMYLNIKFSDDSEVFKPHSQDILCQAFQQRLTMSESCENCCFTKFPRPADLTLGDFHRIEESDSRFAGFRTEALLINNSKGKELFNIIKKNTLQCEKQDISLLSNGNKICANLPAHPMREKFTQMCEQEIPFTKAVDILLNNRYDIGLVGMPSNSNYGGALTYFALYKVLKDLGKSVLFIQQPADSYWKPSEKITAFKNNPYYDFEFAKIYPNRDSMRELNNYCNIFMVGSDQLFATEGLYEFCNKFVSLDWVDNRKKKVAYAASFGRDFITCDDYNRSVFGYYLNKFDMFTVRETSAKYLCTKEFGIKSDVVLDPVFLCDKKHYNELIKSGNFTGNEKIASYVLDKTPLSEKILKDIQIKLNISHIGIDDFYKSVKYNESNENAPKIEDWLSLISGCEFLITDSFHGMCFAIIYKKPFIAICNAERGASRFESLVELLGLKERLVYSSEDYKSIKDTLTEIDWNSVYEKLEKLKNKSFDFLKQMITDNQIKKSASDYDLYRPDILKLKHNQHLMDSKIDILDNIVKTLVHTLDSDLRERALNNTDSEINFAPKSIFAHSDDIYEEIHSSEISVVVQGAVKEDVTSNSLKSIRKFLPNAEIILSTWHGTDTTDLDYDVLILSDDPGAVKTDLVNNITNNQNRQFVSTKEGIKKASRKYILKLRTDFELHGTGFLKYWNRFPVRDTFHNVFRHRIIVSSVFSREYSCFNHRPVLFHPSDLFLFGLAEDIKDYFESIRIATKKELGDWQYLYPNRIPYPEAQYRYAPEQFFFLSYVKHFFPDIKFADWTDWNETNQEISKKLMYNNFIFLDYDQAQIYSEKFFHALKHPEEIFGLITFEKFEEIYKKIFSFDYITEKYVENESKSLKKYKKYKAKFHKHFYYYLAPFRKFVTWLWQPVPILYSLVRVCVNNQFFKRCFNFCVYRRKSSGGIQ